MFKTFFTAEIKRALKQPMIYIFFALIALMTFAATASDNFSIGGSAGNVYRNSPHIITIYVTILTIFGLLIATAFYNNAALRDYNNNFNEILFSKPISKFAYFFGRFFGALILSTIPILGVFFGVMLGTVAAPVFGWIDADRFGSFYFETFVNNYFLFILPNMFIAGAIIFAMANKFKSTVISFVGTLLIVIAYIVAGTLMSDIENETLASVVDMFGIKTYSLQTKYYTTIEKNTLSPEFGGLILLNRLVWVLVALVVILVSYFSFSFTESNKKVRIKKEVGYTAGIEVLSLPKFSINFDKKSTWIQFKSFFRTNLLSIIKSVTFKILFLFSAILLITELFGGFEYYGLKSYPLTYKMIGAISNMSGLFVLIILVFFSGELVWRDRANKINEVIDSTPHSSFISMAAKSLSLLVTTFFIHFFAFLVSIFYQLINGYTRLEVSIYFLDFIYDYFFFYVVWSALLIFIQVLLNNKYIAYFVSIIIILFWGYLLSILDVQTNMLHIGGKPFLLFSDFNGFGPGLKGAMWFNLYWTLFAFIILIITGIFWNRGILSNFKERIKYAKKSFNSSYGLSLFIVGGLWLVLASFVYYNTKILNTYKTSDEYEELAVKYENKYKKYQNINLPKITDAKYHINIYPHKRDVYVKAILKLTNESNQDIDSLHFSVIKRWNHEVQIPGAKLVLNDEELNYRIYKLASVLKAGQSIEATITAKYITKGFENSAGNTNIVKNGTFLNNFYILPNIGYSESREISDKNTRKKYGLKPKDRMPKLEDSCSVNCMKNYLTNGRADYINVETIISTSDDQIAIAPGSLQKKWQEKGRNFYHYKIDHPSQNFYSFISAKYQVATRKWNGIDIEIYYNKKHSWNIEMMLDAVERSLKYYTKNFGKYYHKQCRIIEFPRYSTFAQAFPGTMPYSESFGFVINLEDETENNIIDAVIAHEMSHQWWAHQVVGSKMQGSTMLSESFAEYSSLMTMKSIAKTPMQMKKFTKYNHNRYLRGRGFEMKKELPLYKVENQSYIHYGKGSIILYALQDYIGEDKLNTALRSFLDEYKYRKPPYPTSLCFLEYLEPQVPDSMKYLVKDWIKEITLYDNRLKKATYKKLDNGKYVATVDIESYKIKADTIGKETKVPINDWIDIGFFADDDEEKLMFEKRIKIDQNKMSLSFELDTIPAKAAIDPRMLLIDRIYDDNIKKVKKN